MESEAHPTPPAPASWAHAKEIGMLLRTQWPKYLVDILVIILSITLSFMFDSFKEDSGRKASERAYLKALQGDIESDIQELKNVIAQTENVVAKANWLVNLPDDAAAINRDEFAEAIKQVVERPNFNSKGATFSDLTSSGNMLLLEDINLKAALFEYYRFYESIRAVEVAERETMNVNVAPYLIRNFSIKRLARGATGSVLHQGVELNDLLHNDDFTNIFSIRLVSRKELLDDYRIELASAEKIKVLLHSKINPD